MDSFHSVTKASQYATAASPGVSLERGNYRMRAPNTRPLPTLLQTQKEPVRRWPQQRANRHLAFLLMLLVAACITCFGTAYYLYITRWDLQVIYAASTLANSTSQATGSEEPTTLNRSEKYLSYLPHSGFHNQRIALENALALAHALRRTLLVPPIRLGNTPIRYVEYDTLSRYHELSGREGLSHCPQIPAYISQPPECLHYSESSYVPWTWLIDFSTLGAHQTFQHLPTMSSTWIAAHLNIKPSDIYTLKDKFPYQFHFLDEVNDSSPTQDKYQQDIYIPRLLSVEQTLLQIGTLFGTSRLRIKNADNLAYREAIRRNMVFANKDLTSTADSIAQSLTYSYIAVHLRLGDGLFKAKNEDTVNSVWLKVLHDVLGLSLPQICELATLSVAHDQISAICDLEPMEIELEKQGLLQIRPSPTISKKLSRVDMLCRGPKHSEPHLERLNIPLYVGTDLLTPETHPLLSIFRRTFPCIFFLGDFSSEIKALKQLKSPYDGVYLDRFIFPFVDALVVGKALKVVGTEGSTFSRFVEEILWTSFRNSTPF